MLVTQCVILFATPWTIAHQAPSQGKNTRVGCHFLLEGASLTQGLNPSLLHCRQTLYHLSHQGICIMESWQQLINVQIET